MDGDENSHFFHGAVKSKNRKNRLHGLSINCAWNTEPSEIKKEVHEFFVNKFYNKWPNRPKLVSDGFKTIMHVDREMLDVPITIEEIKSAIWCSGGDKSPGPDGYTFKILKHNWDLMQHDITRFVSYFERHGKFAFGCNASFITLIPKMKDPLLLADYRPINLIECMYKVVAKVLASILKRVVRLVVEEVQSTYIKGRNILEGPLIINEIHSWAKKIKRKAIFVQGRL